MGLIFMSNATQQQRFREPGAEKTRLFKHIYPRTVRRIDHQW